jgi:dTDP-4-dehydrorhamnose reductase
MLELWSDVVRSPEDQVRSFTEVWQATPNLRPRDVAVETETLRSLFGGGAWKSLLLWCASHHETGAFDISGPRFWLTALGRAVQERAATERSEHSALAAPSWWRRPGRFSTSVPVGAGVDVEPEDKPWDEERAAVAVLRDTEHYAEVVARICEMRGLKPIILGEAALPAALAYAKIWAVLDPTILPAASAAQRYPGGTFWSDVQAGMRVAALSGQAGVQLLSFSSGLVFDGRAGTAVESDPVCPSSLFGRSAAEREARVLEAYPGALVARAGFMFGQGDERDVALRLLLDPPERWLWYVRKAVLITPAYLPDLVHAALDLLIDGESGLWHLANAGRTTWPDFARQLAAVAGKAQPEPARDIEAGAAVNLASARGTVMPALAGAIGRYGEAVLRPLCFPELIAE